MNFAEMGEKVGMVEQIVISVNISETPEMKIQKKELKHMLINSALIMPIKEVLPNNYEFKVFINGNWIRCFKKYSDIHGCKKCVVLRIVVTIIY
jgi:hypothetical protein